LGAAWSISLLSNVITLWAQSPAQPLIDGARSKARPVYHYHHAGSHGHKKKRKKKIKK